jgi:hypothetical protein
MNHLDEQIVHQFVRLLRMLDQQLINSLIYILFMYRDHLASEEVLDRVDHR